MTGEFLWSEHKIQKVRSRLESMPSVFSLLQHPQLASLICCRGIQFELNTPMNRLTEFIHSDSELPWLSRILATNFGYKIEIYKQDESEFRLLKEELVELLSPESLNAHKRLTKLVFDPLRISYLLKSRGVDLVIVREWVLATALAIDPQHAVYYTQANPWEFKNNVGYQQCELMLHHQLPFFGTHDIADHIGGSYRAGLEKSYPEIVATYNVMQQKFSANEITFSDLTYSYLLSLLLDDLAQPRWHGNEFHASSLRYILKLWQRDSESCSDFIDPHFQIPRQFSTIMELLRNVKSPEMLLPIYEQIENLKTIWQGAQAAS